MIDRPSDNFDLLAAQCPMRRSAVKRCEFDMIRWLIIVAALTQCSTRVLMYNKNLCRILYPFILSYTQKKSKELPLVRTVATKGTTRGAKCLGNNNLLFRLTAVFEIAIQLLPTRLHNGRGTQHQRSL